MRKVRACKTSGERTVVAHANVNPMRKVNTYETSGERTVMGHHVLREARARQIQLGSSI